MASQVILKKSSVAARVPVVGDLVYGELALNYADGLLYYKKSDGTTIGTIGNGTTGPSTYTSYDRQKYTATAAQTTFAVTYSAPFVQVFINGVLIDSTEYTATSGTDIVLVTGALVGDLVECIGFKTIGALSDTAATSNTVVLRDGSGGTAAVNGTFSGSVGIGTTAPIGKLTVVSTSGTGTTNSAWSSAYSVFGPNAATATGAALGFGYNTTSDASEIISLAPAVAWKMLNIFSAGITFNSSTGSLAGSISSSGGNLTMSGNITAYSDIRLKTDLKVIDNAVNKVKQLTGYTYTRIDSNERQTGLIAQDVQKVLPEAVAEGEYLSLAYGNIIGLLVEAIKEQQKVAETQEARIARLEELLLG